MFSIYAGNAHSSCLVVSAVASCFTHAGLQHWNFGHRNCCASVERSMSWRRLNVADGWRRSKALAVNLSGHPADIGLSASELGVTLAVSKHRKGDELPLQRTSLSMWNSFLCRIQKAIVHAGQTYYTRSKDAWRISDSFSRRGKIGYLSVWSRIEYEHRLLPITSRVANDAAAAWRHRSGCGATEAEYKSELRVGNRRRKSTYTPRSYVSLSVENATMRVSCTDVKVAAFILLPLLGNFARFFCTSSITHSVNLISSFRLKIIAQ